MDIVWVGVAFIIGIIVSKAKIPPLVGYLIAGLLLSLTGYEGGELLHQISHLGVIFLLFTVGLHINLKNILRSEVLGVGLTHLFISALIFTPLCLWFGLEPEAAVIVGITLGFSSTVLTAKTLDVRNEMGAYYGRVAIGILILQDLVAIGIIAYSGGGIPSPWALSLVGLPLLRPVFSWVLSIIRRDELILLMALSLAMGGDVLFNAFNLSGELGALVVGMIFANDERGDQLEKKIWGIKEAFLVGFFLEIGLGGFPASTSYLFIGILLLLLSVKFILFYGLFMQFRLRARTAFLSTTTLTAYSEFTLIAGAVAASADIIPFEYVSILGLLTAISYTINTFIVINEDRLWDRFGHLFHRFERDVKHPDHQPMTLGAAEYLIIGMGKAGCSAYDRIKNGGGLVVGFDIDPDVIKKHMDAGRRVVYADVQDIDMWEELDMSNVEAVIVSMSSNLELKKHIVKLIRTKNKFSGDVYVLTLNEREDEQIKQIGAIPVSVPSVQIGERMADLGMGKIPA
ncbi:MAG: cation:proton antiporter [Cyclonatronaceae bacterium]